MADPVFLVVGLGNPGSKYEATRHNVGFRAVEVLASRLGVKLDTKRFNAKLGRTRIDGGTLWLSKPQTWMNKSG